MYAGFCKYLKFVQDNKMSGIIEIILMHTQNVMLATMCCLDRASVSTLPTMQWTHGNVSMVPAMQDRIPPVGAVTYKCLCNKKVRTFDKRVSLL